MNDLENFIPKKKHMVVKFEQQQISFTNITNIAERVNK